MNPMPAGGVGVLEINCVDQVPLGTRRTFRYSSEWWFWCTAGCRGFSAILKEDGECDKRSTGDSENWWNLAKRRLRHLRNQLDTSSVFHLIAFHFRDLCRSESGQDYVACFPCSYFRHQGNERMTGYDDASMKSNWARISNLRSLEFE